MQGLSPERVHAATAAWVWVPPTAARIETEEYLAVRYPTWWEHPVQLVRLRPRRPVGEVLDEVLDRARELADGIAPQIACWVRLDAPAGLEEALLSRGGVLDETVDVLAADLTGYAPATLEPAPDVELRWSDELSVLLDAAELGVTVFGGSQVDRAALAEQLTGEVHKHRTGGGGSVVAYLDGRPVGTGGLTVAGPDARLWSGAVLPGHRGRGVYRALLAARLAYGIDQRSEVALVKARVESSGPVLRRAGFAPYGQERSYLVGLRPAGS